MCIFLKQSLRGMGVGIYCFLCFTPTPIRTYPYRCEWDPSHTNNMAKNEGEGSKVPSMLQRHWEFLGGLLGQPTSLVTDFSRNFENLSHTISSKNVSTSRSEDLMQTCLIPSPQLASVFHSVYTIIPELLSSPEQKRVLLVVAPRWNLLQVYWHIHFARNYMAPRHYFHANSKMGNVSTSPPRNNRSLLLPVFMHVDSAHFWCAIQPV